MRFLFLNQYAPPDPAPTARLLGELAETLRAQGHTVEIVSPSEGYHARPARGGSRLRREIRALWTIFQAGARQEKVDVILSLSSPPGLLAVAAVLASRHRARLAYWAMDLYPELALELGEISAGLPYRLTRLAMAWACRRCALIVALDEDMQAHLRQAYGVDAMVLPPWPPPSSLAALETAEPGATAGTENASDWIWLYSGNLGRAHEWEGLLEIQAKLEARGLPIRLVFQGDGAARPAAQVRVEALGLKRCVWKGYAAEDALVDSLLAARLLIVTQRPATQGLLWPSKLALIERLPRPVFWLGPADSAIARRLRTRGEAGVFAPGQIDEAARWIEERFHHPPSVNIHPAPNRDTACIELAAMLTALRP